ncbi:hypothetical protein Tco_1213345 [Tanacetum coccineum]
MMPGDQFHIFVCPGVSEPTSRMLPYLFAHARLGSVSLLRCVPLVLQHGIRASEFMFWNLHVKVSKEFLFPYPADQALFTRLFRLLRIGTPGPTDGANVEAYMRGPLGLGK